MTSLATTFHIGVGTTIGAVTVFPIWTQPLGFQPYVARRDSSMEVFTVEELDSPSVPSLSLVNRGGEPVLLLEGETVTGGLQDRVMNVTVLVPPAASVVAPVACLEAGRFSPMGSGRRPGHATPSLRRLKNHAVTDSRRSGSWATDQDAVWQEVDRLRVGYGADAPTSSYHDVRDHALRARHRHGAIPTPLDGQRGVVFGIAGRIRALDLFDRPETLRTYWVDLMEAALVESLDSVPRRTSSAGVRHALRKLNQMPLSSAPSLGLGEDIRAADSGVVVSGLRVDQHLVHLSAQWALAA